MTIALIAQMAAEGLGDRAALGPSSAPVTYAELWERSQQAAEWIEEHGSQNVVFIDTNSPAMPYLLFGAALANRPFVPLNYRLADPQLRAILERLTPAVGITDEAVSRRLGAVPGVDFTARNTWLADIVGDRGSPATSTEARPFIDEPEGIAVLLFTSGTSGEPKAAVLRHRHLFSYVISTVEFMSADPDEVTLISVPPYHVAGIAAVLSGVYSGRRMIQLESFDPAIWVDIARDEHVTHAMVVPTMLDRILDVLEDRAAALPSLRHLSYGGGRMPLPTIERALTLLPGADFVNAYGLTETSSTISILTPEDHRVAFASPDPEIRARLRSVGRPIETLELEIRGDDGEVLGPNVPGEIYVRGEQIAGEYLGSGPALVDGWFPTNDSGYLDPSGYLYLDGRLDDVIVRGGENISPGEVEDALLSHPAVVEAGVVGLPDPEWGESVVAAVVIAPGAAVPSEEELQEWVRKSLRSSRTPHRIVFLDALPYTDTGKLLRRVLRKDLGEVRA